MLLCHAAPPPYREGPPLRYEVPPPCCEGLPPCYEVRIPSHELHVRDGRSPLTTVLRCPDLATKLGSTSLNLDQPAILAIIIMLDSQIEMLEALHEVWTLPQNTCRILARIALGIGVGIGIIVNGFRAR